MRICIPVEEDRGLESPVCGHFGSAPLFLIVDTESNETETVPNQNQHHAHGMCQPLAAISGRKVDAALVGGIGPGALEKLTAGGLTVYQAGPGTVAESLARYRSGTLVPMTAKMVCGGHAGQPGAGHGHGTGRGRGHRAP